MLAKIKEKFVEFKFRKKYDILEEGEVECSMCDGTGKDFDSPIPKLSYCRRCGGLGKTDWVTNVMGRPEEEESYRSSSVSSSYYLRRVK
jgi:DnaJ-class molecular chaperone